MQVHAGVRREERDHLSTRLVERAAQEPGPALQPMRLELAKGERLGELVADEGAAEDDRDLRLRDPRDHGLRLVEVLEVEEIGRVVGAGDAQRVGTAACGDEEPVVSQLGPRLDRDGPLLEIDLGDARLEPEIDAVLHVPLHVPDLHALLEEHASEVARERHAVVERVFLVVDHDDLGRGVVLAQLLGRVSPGRAVADDDETSGVRCQPAPSAKCALSLAEVRGACLSWMCRRIPTAEERVLKTPQCGFESRRRHNTAALRPLARPRSLAADG